jgi:hypothetical protein
MITPSSTLSASSEINAVSGRGVDDVLELLWLDGAELLIEDDTRVEVELDPPFEAAQAHTPWPLLTTSNC